MNIDRFMVALTSGEWTDCLLFKNDCPDEVFGYVERFYSQTGIVPQVSVVRNKFPDIPEPSNTPLEFYKNELQDEFFIERAAPILEQFNNKSQYDFTSALLQLKAALQDLQYDSNLKVHSLKQEVDDRIHSFEVSAPARIKTGIEPLDRAMGGMEQDEFFIISARLGIGKSWLGQFISANLAKEGKTVLFYSGEMSVNQVGSRIDTILLDGNISNFLYTRNRLNSDEKLNIRNTVSRVEGDILVFTPEDLSRGVCRPSDIERYIKAFNPDVVVIDQISLMEPDNGRYLHSDQERKAELSYQLKTLQSRSPRPFILISQLNRGAQNEEATAANIAGSDRIGQDASLVVALKRKDDRLCLNILKARSFSPQDGAIEFTWDVDRGRLTPVLSGMDAVRARARQAQQQDEVESRGDDDDLDSWEE